MHLLSISVIAVIFTAGAACAQPVMSEREVILKIEEWVSELCFPIPVGTRKTAAPLVMNDREKAFVRSVVALEKAGVVNFTSEGSLTENFIKVELSQDFDKSNLSKKTAYPCLRQSDGLKIGEVTKIDGTQGGSALKWNAAVAYILYDYIPNPTAKKYLDAMGNTDVYGKRKGVYLFRQDPFNQQWKLIAVDSVNANAPFSTLKVAQRLRGD